MTNYDFIDEFIANPQGRGVHGHMYYIDGALVHYSTPLAWCKLTGDTMTVNVSKISRTTSKIQSYLLRALKSHGYNVEEVKTGMAGYYWNMGYMGARNWSIKELKERGIF